MSTNQAPSTELSAAMLPSLSRVQVKDTHFSLQSRGKEDRRWEGNKKGGDSGMHGRASALAGRQSEDHTNRRGGD